jgi:hypothetical protein
MTKYIIEGNLNFYDELFKSLDNDSDDEDNLCLITGLPLTDKIITLECNHKFNHEPLYKEICKQKFEYKTYTTDILTKQDKLKFTNSSLDYFIKCPYCRNIQFTILPYYEELGLEKKYGVNSLDKTLQSALVKLGSYYNTTSHSGYSGPYYGSDDYTFMMFGTLFKKGQCCEKIHENKPEMYLCNSKYVGTIPNTNLSYCKYHYKNGVRNCKLLERKKIVDEKNKQKEEVNKQKEEVLNERKKLFDEKNNERITKGLPLLKRLPVIKKNIENIVQSVQQIGQYIPEIEPQNNVGCKSILKTGLNKGKMCGCQKVNEHFFCKRHDLHIFLI